MTNLIDSKPSADIALYLVNIKSHYFCERENIVSEKIPVVTEIGALEHIAHVLLI